MKIYTIRFRLIECTGVILNGLQLRGAAKARKQKDILKSNRQTNVQSLGLINSLEDGQTNPKVGVMCWDGAEGRKK